MSELFLLWFGFGKENSNNKKIYIYLKQRDLCSVSLGGLRVGEVNVSRVRINRRQRFLVFPTWLNTPPPHHPHPHPHPPPRGASRARWPSTHAKLELVPFFFKSWQPWFFVVMCNTVCTVCRKEENTRKKEKKPKSLLQNYFHCKRCDSQKSFSTVYLPTLPARTFQ